MRYVWAGMFAVSFAGGIFAAFNFRAGDVAPCTLQYRGHNSVVHLEGSGSSELCRGIVAADGRWYRLAGAPLAAEVAADPDSPAFASFIASGREICSQSFQSLTWSVWDTGDALHGGEVCDHLNAWQAGGRRAPWATRPPAPVSENAQSVASAWSPVGALLAAAALGVGAVALVVFSERRASVAGRGAWIGAIFGAALFVAMTQPWLATRSLVFELGLSQVDFASAIVGGPAAALTMSGWFVAIAILALGVRAVLLVALRR